MISVAVAGVAILCERDGIRDAISARIRALADVPAISREQRRRECFLDLRQETTFADSCVEAKRPLVLTWGDSTVAALMPASQAPAGSSFWSRPSTTRVWSAPGCWVGPSRLSRLSRCQ